uniref:Uncharacterized protein n=1 Tax=Plectus sambesii TaxID=2011161 RepID=A0A914WZX5_9BILA
MMRAVRADCVGAGRIESNSTVSASGEERQASENNTNECETVGRPGPTARSRDDRPSRQSIRPEAPSSPSVGQGDARRLARCQAASGITCLADFDSLPPPTPPPPRRAWKRRHVRRCEDGRQRVTLTGRTSGMNVDADKNAPVPVCEIGWSSLRRGHQPSSPTPDSLSPLLRAGTLSSNTFTYARQTDWYN